MTDDDGDGTTAMGNNAVANQNMGDATSNNTAIGYAAGYNNVTGIHNTHIGANAGYGGTGSNGYNTSVGSGALQNITTGDSNVGVGYRSCNDATTGDGNTGVGNRALADADEDLTGSNNTAVGEGAGINLQGAAASNTLIGAQCGATITTGGTNTLIGFDVDVPATRDSAVAIGRSFAASGDENSFTVGNGSNTTVYDLDSGNITITSDRRVKDDIVDSPIGLTFIDKLKPVQFVKKAPSEWPAEFWNLSKLPEDSPERTSTEKGKKVQTGLIAQEVKEVIDELDIDFLGWSEQEETGKQELSYISFVVPLVKAVQELSAKVKALEDAQ